MSDYYSVLSSAVSSLETNTVQSRTLLYDRARQTLINQFRNDSSHWTEERSAAELARFESAVDRIERDIGVRTGAVSQPADRMSGRAPASDQGGTGRGSSRLMRVAGWSALAALVVALTGVAVHVLRGVEVGPSKPDNTVVTPVVKGGAGKVATKEPLPADDLEPGVDGGSTDAGLPYFLRRQAVYYRSVYSAGMILVDRSQRFLYLIEQQSRAVRYGIGVGGECNVSAGLYRIRNKRPWPDWSPSPALLKRHAYPQRFAGGPGNPLGAYALYFEDQTPGIHGTNAPRSIGQAPALGCLRLVNDDIVHLEKRVPIDSAVVVLN